MHRKNTRRLSIKILARKNLCVKALNDYNFLLFAKVSMRAHRHFTGDGTTPWAGILDPIK